MHASSRSLLLLFALALPLVAQAVHTVPLKKARDVRSYRQILRKVRGTMLTVEWKEESLATVVKDLKRRLGVNFLVDRSLKERAAEDRSSFEKQLATPVEPMEMPARVDMV